MNSTQFPEGKNNNAQGHEQRITSIEYSSLNLLNLGELTSEHSDINTEEYLKQRNEIPAGPTDEEDDDDEDDDDEEEEGEDDEDEDDEEEGAKGAPQQGGNDNDDDEDDE